MYISEESQRVSVDGSHPSSEFTSFCDYSHVKYESDMGTHIGIEVEGCTHSQCEQNWLKLV